MARRGCSRGRDPRRPALGHARGRRKQRRPRAARPPAGSRRASELNETGREARCRAREAGRLRHAADIAGFLSVVDRLAAEVARRGSTWVITHGEPHSATLCGPGADHALVDWDTVALAPRERDLWMLAADNSDDLAAYTNATGHGSTAQRWTSSASRGISRTWRRTSTSSGHRTRRTSTRSARTRARRPACRAAKPGSADGSIEPVGKRVLIGYV